jgi:hypothetical protein
MDKLSPRTVTYSEIAVLYFEVWWYERTRKQEGQHSHPALKLLEMIDAGMLNAGPHPRLCPAVVSFCGGGHCLGHRLTRPRLDARLNPLAHCLTQLIRRRHRYGYKSGYFSWGGRTNTLHTDFLDWTTRTVTIYRLRFT